MANYMFQAELIMGSENFNKEQNLKHWIFQTKWFRGQISPEECVLRFLKPLRTLLKFQGIMFMETLNELLLSELSPYLFKRASEIEHLVRVLLKEMNDTIERFEWEVDDP